MGKLKDDWTFWGQSRMSKSEILGIFKLLGRNVVIFTVKKIPLLKYHLIEKHATEVLNVSKTTTKIT